MKKNPLMISIGLLAVITTAVYIIFRFIGIDSNTGLIQNETLLLLCHLLFLSCLVLSFIPGVLYYPNFFPKKNKYGIDERPRDIHPLIATLFQGNTAIFFVAMLCVFLVVLVLVLYEAIVSPAVGTFLFALFLLAAVWGMVRLAWSSLTAKVKNSDAVVLLFPVLFIAYFCIFEYRLIALEPQTSIYYPELMAILFSLLSILSFIGHYFGRIPNGNVFFLSLCGTIFSSAVYLSLLVEYCRSLISNSNVLIGSFLMEGARVMVFAALAIWNGIYAVALYNHHSKTQK